MPVASSASRFQFSHRRRASWIEHTVALGLTAVLLMLAFPRPGWGWLAWVALVPMGVAAGRTTSWRRLFVVSWVVLGLWWWWMLRWLGPVSPAAAPVLGVWLGLNVAAGVVAVGVMYRKLRWPMAVALPLGWVSVEALRSVWPVGGISWFSLAHSQAAWEAGDVGRVVQVADLFGQHTVGLVVAAVNGAVVEVLLRRRVPRATVVATLALAAAAWGYGQWRMMQWDGVTTAGPRVAVVQTDVVNDNQTRPTAEDWAARWESLAQLQIEASRARAGSESDRPDLVVWPETVVPAVWLESVSELVRLCGVATVVGTNTVETDPGVGERRFNSALFVEADGGVAVERYHKQHRVPMGEYIPGPGFVASLVARLSPWEEAYELTPGDRPVVFEVGNDENTWRFATPICYEDAVAATCRRMVYAEGEKRLNFLANLTNNGWFTGRGMRRQHAQLASLRCIENRVPMVRSVNTGISTAIDSLGRPSARLNSYEAGTLTHDLRVDRRLTLYAVIGGWPWVVMILVTLGATVFGATFGRSISKHRVN
ncbi:MAG: apolipoprotein N-acyltransferase [Planctomycetota bacterium]